MTPHRENPLPNNCAGSATQKNSVSAPEAASSAGALDLRLDADPASADSPASPFASAPREALESLPSRLGQALNERRWADAQKLVASPAWGWKANDGVAWNGVICALGLALSPRGGATNGAKSLRQAKAVALAMEQSAAFLPELGEAAILRPEPPLSGPVRLQELLWKSLDATLEKREKAALCASEKERGAFQKRALATRESVRKKEAAFICALAGDWFGNYARAMSALRLMASRGAAARLAEKDRQAIVEAWASQGEMDCVEEADARDCMSEGEQMLAALESAGFIDSAARGWMAQRICAEGFFFGVSAGCLGAFSALAHGMRSRREGLDSVWEALARRCAEQAAQGTFPRLWKEVSGWLLAAVEERALAQAVAPSAKPGDARGAPRGRRI